MNKTNQLARSDAHRLTRDDASWRKRKDDLDKPNNTKAKDAVATRDASIAPLAALTRQSATRLKYITHVPGKTLREILEKIQFNEEVVRELDLSDMAMRNRKLQEKGGVLLARVFETNRTVKKLVLQDHEIGDCGALAIAKMLKSNNTLEHVDLYGNNITDEGVEAIAQVLHGHPSVQYLGLWSNRIGDAGAMALANALRANCTLTYLGLVHNRIGAKGAEALIEAMDQNQIIQVINLATNCVPNDVMSRLNTALAVNKIRHLQLKREEEKLAQEKQEEPQQEEPETPSEQRDTRQERAPLATIVTPEPMPKPGSEPNLSGIRQRSLMPQESVVAIYDSGSDDDEEEDDFYEEEDGAVWI